MRKLFPVFSFPSLLLLLFVLLPFAPDDSHAFQRSPRWNPATAARSAEKAFLPQSAVGDIKRSFAGSMHRSLDHMHCNTRVTWIRLSSRKDGAVDGAADDIDDDQANDRKRPRFSNRSYTIARYTPVVAVPGSAVGQAFDLESLSGRTNLACPNIEHLQFVLRPDSFPTDDLRSFLTKGIAEKLFYACDRRQPVIAAIRAASGTGKSAILDNIDKVMGMDGQVLIVKATYGLDQDHLLVYDKKYPSGCLSVRFMVHLQNEASLGTDIEPLLRKSFEPKPWKEGTEEYVAELALQKMRATGKTRIAFVVDEVENICSSEDDSKARDIHSSLVRLVHKVAVLNALQTRNVKNQRDIIDEDVVASGIMSVLPKLSLYDLTGRPVEFFDGLALSVNESFEVARAAVNAYCVNVKDSGRHIHLNNGVPRSQQDAIVRHAAGYGGPHARTIVTYVTACARNGTMHIGPLHDGADIAKTVFGHFPFDQFPAEDVTDSMSCIVKYDKKLGRTKAENKHYSSGNFPAMKGSSRLSIPMGLLMSFPDSDDLPVASRALMNVASELDAVHSKAAVQLYLQVLLFQAVSGLSAFPPGFHRQRWLDDGTLQLLPLDAAPFAPGLSTDQFTILDCTDSRPFLQSVTGHGIQAIQGLDYLEMNDRIFFPESQPHHPVFDLSFPVLLDDEVVVVLVQMSPSREGRGDINVMNQAAAVLRGQGLNVLPMLVSRQQAAAPTGKLEHDHVLVTGDSVDDLMTPSFACLHRALEESHQKPSWLSGLKVRIELQFDSSQKRYSMIGLQEEVQAFLDSSGAEIVESTNEDVDLIVCSRRGNPQRMDCIGWKDLRDGNLFQKDDAPWVSSRSLGVDSDHDTGGSPSPMSDALLAKVKAFLHDNAKDVDKVEGVDYIVCSKRGRTSEGNRISWQDLRRSDFV